MFDLVLTGRLGIGLIISDSQHKRCDRKELRHIFDGRSHRKTPYTLCKQWSGCPSVNDWRYWAWWFLCSGRPFLFAWASFDFVSCRNLSSYYISFYYISKHYKQSRTFYIRLPRPAFQFKLGAFQLMLGVPTCARPIRPRLLYVILILTLYITDRWVHNDAGG